MAIPSKNRRRITVDGKTYYWVFDPYRLQAGDSYLAVQSATGKGRKLYLRWIGLALPLFVREAIQYAIQNGWSPSAESDMEIGCDSFAHPTQFYSKPAGTNSSWFHDWWLKENPGAIFLTPLYDYHLPHWQ